MYDGVDLSGLSHIQSSAITWDTIKRMRDATKMKMVIKGLLAHAQPDASYAELLETMADMALTQIEKKKGIVHDARPAPPAAAAAIAKKPLPAGQRVYLPVSLRRTAFARSGGRCEVSLQGRRCSSRYRLEIDHITPLALNGSNDLTNLRIACWSHNQQQAKAKL
jgi:hypothetical protein